jgi:hypothetical protein
MGLATARLFNDRASCAGGPAGSRSVRQPSQGPAACRQLRANGFELERHNYYAPPPHRPAMLDLSLIPIPPFVCKSYHTSRGCHTLAHTLAHSGANGFELNVLKTFAPARPSLIPIPPQRPNAGPRQPQPSSSHAFVSNQPTVSHLPTSKTGRQAGAQYKSCPSPGASRDIPRQRPPPRAAVGIGSGRSCPVCGQTPLLFRG